MERNYTVKLHDKQRKKYTSADKKDIVQKAHIIAIHGSIDCDECMCNVLLDWMQSFGAIVPVYPFQKYAYPKLKKHSYTLFNRSTFQGTHAFDTFDEARCLLFQFT